MSFECVGAGEGTAWLVLPDLCWHTCLSLESTKFTLTGLFSLSELFSFSAASKLLLLLLQISDGFLLVVGSIS